MVSVGPPLIFHHPTPEPQCTRWAGLKGWYRRRDEGSQAPPPFYYSLPGPPGNSTTKSTADVGESLEQHQGGDDITDREVLRRER